MAAVEGVNLPAVSVNGKPGSSISAQLELARDFIRQSKAENTLRGYRADWHSFCAWCEQRQVRALPAAAETIAAYLAECGESGRLRAGSIQRRVSAIAEAHKATGIADPPTSMGLVRNTMKGIRRLLGTAPKQKAAATIEIIRALIAAADPEITGLRDRALLLVGYAGGFRRSELVALRVEDVSFEPEGMAITIRRSKTDQEGRGRIVGIVHGEFQNTCPVSALRAWIHAAAITEGALFRSIDRNGCVRPRSLAPGDVARTIKKLAAAAGLNAATLSGHSLRAGHVTEATIEGESDIIIAKQTGHASLDTLKKYFRDPDLFRRNSSRSLGL